LAEKLRLVLEADEEELQRLSENSLHLIQSHDIKRTLSIFEDLYRGEGDSEPTTLDNEPSYFLPIGRLPQSVRERLADWREDGLALRARADRLRSEARGRLGEAKERLDEVRAVAREQYNELKTEVTEVAKRLRRKKD
jgi:hypothetical protein